MPRISLTKTVPLGSLPTVPLTALSADVTMTAADTSDLNSFVASGNDLVIAHNSGGAPYTVTITSVALNGRTGDITAYSIAAGGIAVFGPLKAPGWQQSTGAIHLQASNAAVKFGVITLPN